MSWWSFKFYFFFFLCFVFFKLSTRLGSLEKTASKAAAAYFCQMYLALLFVPWQFRISFFFTPITPFKDFHSEQKNKAMRCSATWRGRIMFNTVRGERVEEENEIRTESAKTPGWKRARLLWIPPVVCAVNLCSKLAADGFAALQWLRLRRIPVVSQLSGHPASSTVETHAFHFLLDTRSRRSNSAAPVRSWWMKFAEVPAVADPDNMNIKVNLCVEDICTWIHWGTRNCFSVSTYTIKLHENVCKMLHISHCKFIFYAPLESRFISMFLMYFLLMVLCSALIVTCLLHLVSPW